MTVVRLAARLLLACGLLAGLASSLGAQNSPPRQLLTPEARERVVDSLARTLELYYPAADTGRAIAAHVRQRAAAGAYRNANDPFLFARLLTQDLQATNEDPHLSVSVDGAAQGGVAPPPGHGVERVERLDGNVGYMRMSHFGGDQAFAALEAAIRYLATTDAVIIDLRNSRGGSPAVANFVISHFTGPDTIHSLTVYDRARNTTVQRSTMAQVPGPRRPDVPLYVLVDDVTRSAAEDVPFVLQNMKRATIVGTRTAGAGRNNRGVPLGNGFVASVSFTRVFDPRTHREWERTGLSPDVRVSADSALLVAHALALDTIASRASDPDRRARLTRITETIRGSARPPMPATALQRFVGSYEGGQSIAIEQGRLVYQPIVKQPRVILVPLGATMFASGAARYTFEGSGSAIRLRIVGDDGRESVYPRISSTVPMRPR
jgi:retinol-binding protein 3